MIIKFINEGSNDNSLEVSRQEVQGVVGLYLCIGDDSHGAEVFLSDKTIDEVIEAINLLRKK